MINFYKVVEIQDVKKYDVTNENILGYLKNNVAYLLDSNFKEKNIEFCPRSLSLFVNENTFLYRIMIIL